MKKTLIALFVLAGAASASIGYNGMDSSMKEGIVHHWDDTTTVTSTVTPWTNLNTNTSFTITFDISNIKGVNTESTILSIAGSHNANGWDDGKLLVRMSDSGCLTLFNSHGTSTNSWSQYFDGSTYGSATVSAYTTNLGLTAEASLNTTSTFTLVSDTAAKTFTIYSNGKQIDQWTNWNTDTGITGIQIGNRFGGGTALPEGAGVDLDNIIVWNRALSAAEVEAIAVPEPTTATLSLLALAGLAARRRRK